jgi:hypothetical protein
MYQSLSRDIHHIIIIIIIIVGIIISSSSSSSNMITSLFLLNGFDRNCASKIANKSLEETRDITSRILNPGTG